ncbi:glycoprotein-N-acetylgalactosamine 3-beta-galactosyltransferase 1-like [Artemia franciscana]|uniref:glycoprotein-N-acetylgalactosamine 3-beta-galactosyltransferase 1-like n=1 Tax=Artemia franciscana TaxID=6661 RepID=UPI0032D9C3C1
MAEALASDPRTIGPDSFASEHAYIKVRLLCLIITGAVNHKKKATHIKATWGKRCDILLFASSKEDPTLPTIVLPVPDDWPNLWGKTKEAFKYVYEHYFDKADWFFKADDDTFAIPENARDLLLLYDTNEPIYFGAKMKNIQNTYYAPGGAGYILSKEALRRFVTVAMRNQSYCDINTTIGYEDRNIASCLHKVGVILKDSRDEKGKQRFLPLSPSFHTMPGPVDENHYYYSHTYFKTAKGKDCCSDKVISFHHVLPEEMYIYNFFLYHVRIHGAISSVLIDCGNNKWLNNLSAPNIHDI